MFGWLKRLFGGESAESENRPIVQRRDHGFGPRATPPRAEPKRGTTSSEAAPLARLRIELPDDRTRLGRLTALGKDGQALDTSWPAAGQANRAIAARHGNELAARERRFGDTPLGTYRIVERISYRVMPSELAELAGNMDALIAQATAGEANAAASAGRGPLVIHANTGGGGGAGCGSLALDAADMRRLLRLAPLMPERAQTPIEVEIARLPLSQAGKASAAGAVDVGDPWEAMLVLSGRSPIDDVNRTDDRYDSPASSDLYAADRMRDLGYAVGTYRSSRSRTDDNRAEQVRSSDDRQTDAGGGDAPPPQSRAGDDAGDSGMDNRAGSDASPTGGAYDR